MEKQVIHTKNAPEAIGPYSQAIMAGNFLFISGQIPLDADSNNVVEGDIEIQTAKVLDNVKSMVESVKGTMDNVIKTTIYLADMNDFKRFNAVYSRYFPTDPPARSTVEVARLPKNVLIEIEAIACL